MDIQTVIMVQIADRAWMLDALHCACLLARKMSAKIALMKMIPVQHFLWLGSELGYENFSIQDQRELAEYEDKMEDYGVEFSVDFFQYTSLPEAILQAAEYVNARVVIATLPRSIIPFWGSFQLDRLRRCLSRQERELIEQPAHDLRSLPFADPMQAAERLVS
jgi:hypothetical protein